MGGEATVDLNGDPGDEAGLVGGEERDRVGDVLLASLPGDQVVLAEAGQDVG